MLVELRRIVGTGMTLKQTIICSRCHAGMQNEKTRSGMQSFERCLSYDGVSSGITALNRWYRCHAGYAIQGLHNCMFAGTGKIGNNPDE